MYCLVRVGQEFRLAKHLLKLASLNSLSVSPHDPVPPLYSAVKLDLASRP